MYHYDNKRSLVMNQVTGDVRMMKTLSHYDENVYAYIYANKDKHIPEIIEFFKDSNNNLIVIEEYVQGNTFDIVINDQSMPYKTKLKYFLDLLEGLSFLHSAPAPIIHRDLKPANIMVTDKGDVKILDYDAAKIFKPENTRDTTLLGTAGMAAPEQYGFMQSDPRSDVYAVGMMLARAFPNDSRIQKIASIATTFDPNGRYTNAQELSDVLSKRLSPTLKLKPIFPPPGFRTRKWWKMIIATFFYLYVISLLIGYHGSDDPLTNNMCLILTIVLILVALDICNSWSGLFDTLPFITHKNRALRYLFKVLYILAAFVVLFIIAVFSMVIIMKISNA